MNTTIQNETLTRTGPSATTRRALIHASVSAVAAGLAIAGTTGRTQAADVAPAQTSGKRAFQDDHQPVPLPFAASSLKGLSERLIESHWANNYGGSVRALNEVNRRLAQALAEPDFPAFVYDDLKREHLARTGSVVLHELYFANLGGGGAAPAAVRTAIAASFGSYDRWETEFRRIAAGLGGGSGWVVLGFNWHLEVLENYWMADHMHGPIATEPLLVLDMYEHSYQMDYGAAAARYVDAFFANVNWDAVAARFEAGRPAVS